MTFSVAEGEALLTASKQGDEMPVASVDAWAVVPIPNSPGNYAAQVHVRFPATAKNSSVIIAVVRSGEKTNVARTKVEVSDPRLSPPTNFRLIKNSATTATYRWTPSNPPLAIRIEISLDEGATWKAAGTFPAGSTEGTIYHIRPDSTVMCRVRTIGKEDKAAEEP